MVKQYKASGRRSSGNREAYPFYPVKKKEDYNFDLYQIDYEKVLEETKEYPKEDKFELFKKGYITYSSQDKVIPEETEYETQ